MSAKVPVRHWCDACQVGSVELHCWICGAVMYEGWFSNGQGTDRTVVPTDLERQARAEVDTFVPEHEPLVTTAWPAQWVGAF